MHDERTLIERILMHWLRVLSDHKELPKRITLANLGPDYCKELLTNYSLIYVALHYCKS
jgi:hypothetical protein